MENWVGTWACSPAAPTYFIPVEFIPAPFPVRGTLRTRVRVCVGGKRLHLRFSNETGTDALQLGAVSVGLANADASIVAESLTRVTFSQRHGVRIPPGAAVVSDPIALATHDFSDLIVSIFLPHDVVLAQGGNTHKIEATSTNDDVMSARWSPGPSLSLRPLLSAISTEAAPGTRVVVTLGDSITDGSTDHSGCARFGFRGWPEILASHLRTQQKGHLWSVVNAGIGGNRLLHNFIGPVAVARIDRDVFAIPGVSHLVLSAGVNDIGIGGRTINGHTWEMTHAEDLIAAYVQIVERAHEQGLTVIGATLPPFRDAFYFLEEKELVRQEVNHWLRTAKPFDALVDFAQVLADPTDPSRLRADYDTGDHLHPNETAFRAMGQAFDLALFAPPSTD